MSFEVVFEKRFSNANVHRDVDVEQRRQYFLLTILAAVFVLGLLFYGWQQYRWIDLGYKIEAAQQEKDRASGVPETARSWSGPPWRREERIDCDREESTGNGGGGSRSDRDREVGLAFPAVCRYRCDTAERGQEVR